MAAACGLALSATTLPAAAAAGQAPLARVAATTTDDAPVRTIVTTDPELDDLNSMLRMLLYSNEIQIDGLVYASGQHHYKGDPEAGIEPHRWPAEGDTLHIDTAVNAYEEVYDNLVVHDPNYPSPAELRSKIAVGNVTMEGEMEADTPGSDLIRETLLEDNDDTIFLQVWGGPSTVARALKSIEEEYSGTDSWGAIQEHVSSKAIITAWGHQDQTFREYIRPNWPDIEFREVSTSIWGYGARGATPPGTAHYLEPEWMSENISSVGPLGREYRVWGDGKQMAAGFDDEDYFGLSGYTADQLREMGYVVWTPPQAQGAWISEGDSSNFALLIDNGLRNYEHPSYGGWGGRQTQNAEDPNYWANRGTQDANEAGEYPRDYPAARWFETVHLDFAARLQWSVTDRYEDANHHPEAAVAEGLDHTVYPGREVTLTGSATDPDGDDVTLEWWQYQEAGTHPGAVELDAEADGSVSVQIPADAESGDTVHLILEATDDGDPTLVHYQRVILTVGDPSDEDGIPVRAEVPELGGPEGALTLSVTNYGNGVTLAGPTNVGDRLRFDGTLPKITVTDTRNDTQAGSSGWSVSGRASTFTSGTDELSAAYLGWTPWADDLRDGVVLGAPVRGELRGGPGLATPATLASAPAGHRLGTASVKADLLLEVPVDTPDGAYESHLKVSLFPVD